MLTTEKNTFLLFLFSLVIVGNITAQPSRDITLENPEYSTLQFSSYDRASVKPTGQNWFANWYRTMFLREEQNNGRREFVMFEDKSPEAVIKITYESEHIAENGAKGGSEDVYYK